MLNAFPELTRARLKQLAGDTGKALIYPQVSSRG